MALINEPFTTTILLIIYYKYIKSKSMSFGVLKEASKLELYNNVYIKKY
jgi:hypothetical protein